VGAWGVGLFEDDVAADVRAAWEGSIAEGRPPAEITARLIDGIGSAFIDDVDDGPVFWIALAALQLEADALDPNVAQRAAAPIPVNIERWHEEADPDEAAHRERALDDLLRRVSRPSD
jgi:hypothetical protein